ncbi:SAM-dependent methyltransferase [Paucibacter sp. KBW04]|uniref:DUF938 domain-containing protein n=1 Tax=Paucibacter sp. KBW04 TaxID=2153361 RepID=UPI000F5766C5|nr:DUF938 domain-containing protein [Paucibacter sp. KBW04]RQO62016.1 SAM-dependent methyltransferase [Paucibacter sp. KBW04]
MSATQPTHPAARYSPASERNKQPIGEALLGLLPPQGIALEIASGSGQHVTHFAALLPGWQWLASDPDASALASIPHWWPQGPAPLQLDVSQNPWPLPASHSQLDAIFCANMLHISGADSARSLLRGAAQHLRAQGQLIVYGPFIVEGLPTAASNLAFDADLRARNPAWGLRHLSDIEAIAAEQGLHLAQRLNMPANNLLLVFQAQHTPGA